MISGRRFAMDLGIALALLMPSGAVLKAESPEIPTVNAISSIPLNGLPVVGMAADFARPYLYVIEEEGVAARLIVVNTNTEVIERVLPVGDNVFDLDVHYPEARLYFANYLRTDQHRVDLDTLSLDTPLQMNDYVIGLEAGRLGRLYARVTQPYYEGYWIIDTTNGNQVGTIYTIYSSGDFEDAEADPTGRRLFLGDHSSMLYKFDISTDEPQLLRIGDDSPYGADTLFMVPDGLRLFWNETVYNAELVELFEHPDQVFAATYRGHVVFSSSRAYNGFTGDLVAYLPSISSEMAVSGDQQKLFMWDAAADAILVVPINDIASVPPLIPEPIPVDGATIASPLMELSWSAMPHAQAYDVYLGENATQVANATTASSTYQGRVTDPRRFFDPPRELQPETAHYWRVDVVSGGQPIQGPLWSFTTSPMGVSPSQVDVSGITGTPVADVAMSLSTAGAAIGWSATVSEPWLDLSASGGATPTQVSVSFDTTGLPSGVHTTTIDFVADGVSFTVPVRLELLHLRAVNMVADQDRPYLYVLHHNGEQSNNSYLAFVRADTLELVKLISIGTGATDLSINTFEGRLYVNNSTRPRIRVVDLATQTEIGPLDVDMSVAVVNAGRAGRIYVENGYSFSDIAVVNSVTGAIINTFPGTVYDGDAAIDPTGDLYYHADGHDLLKFDISTDNPVLVLEGPWSSDAISFTLLLSGDGQRVYYAGRLYDTNFVELAHFGVAGHALDKGGRRLATNAFVVDTSSGDIISDLPAASTVSVFSADDERIIVTDEVNGSIIDLELPRSAIFADGFESGSTVRWSHTITGG